MCIEKMIDGMSDGGYTMNNQTTIAIQNGIMDFKKQRGKSNEKEVIIVFPGSMYHIFSVRNDICQGVCCRTGAEPKGI